MLTWPPPGTTNAPKNVAVSSNITDQQEPRQSLSHRAAGTTFVSANGGYASGGGLTARSVPDRSLERTEDGPGFHSSDLDRPDETPWGVARTGGLVLRPRNGRAGERIGPHGRQHPSRRTAEHAPGFTTGRVRAHPHRRGADGGLVHRSGGG